MTLDDTPVRLMVNDIFTRITISDGSLVGELLGWPEGCPEGVDVGCADGEVGIAVGWLEGCALGTPVGCIEGCVVGDVEG